MGAKLSVQDSSTVIQKMNNLTQTNQQYCKAESKQLASGNVITISGSTVNSDFIGVRLMGNSTDASCLIASSFDSTTDNIAKSIANQNTVTESGLFSILNFDTSVEVANVKDSVKNNISQVNEAVCSASNISEVSNNYIYVTDSNVKSSFIGVDISNTSANANCTMTNYQKMDLYNDFYANTQQNTKFQTSFAAILGVIVIIIIIAIVAPILIGIISRSSSSVSQKKGF